MAELLLEFLSEEIPARFQQRAATELKDRMTRLLAAAELGADCIETFVTSRRLTLRATGLPVRQSDVRDERRGPRVGAPEQAVAGFLRSAGVALDDCEVREVKGAQYYFAVVEKKGRATREILPELISQVADQIPWTVSMRWAAGTRRWVRPLHGIVALFDGAVLDGGLDIGRGETLPFGDRTLGHRFLSDGWLTVTDYADYEAKLRRAYVLLDQDERRRNIREDLDDVARQAGLRVLEDDALLAEVTGLVEWPVVLKGQIEDGFMDLPREVLSTSMRTHQKYFSMLDPEGRLAPYFLFVANMLADDGGGEIVTGNERVLRARLSDAQYFWEQDRKLRLEDGVDALEKVVFHARLGSVGDKIRRMQRLAGELSGHIPNCDAGLAARAALLAKADLASEMVGEFPELQGVMGRYYAADQGEDSRVATAVAEHYSPAGPGDSCPTAPESVAVALADKIDTLTGFWAIGETPTGSKDPYALRRAALGVIRLVLDNGLRLHLRDVARKALGAYPPGVAGAAEDEITAGLMRFIADRLKVHLREEGVSHEFVAAAFALEEDDDLVRLVMRVRALMDFADSEDGGNLLIAYRRAVNIVRAESKKDGKTYDGAAYDSENLGNDEDRLYRVLVEVEGGLDELVARDRFADAMGLLARLREPVDRFFTNVTVNVDDATTRENRLRLLTRIGSLMHRVADFSEVSA